MIRFGIFAVNKTGRLNIVKTYTLYRTVGNFLKLSNSQPNPRHMRLIVRCNTWHDGKCFVPNDVSIQTTLT